MNSAVSGIERGVGVVDVGGGGRDEGKIEIGEYWRAAAEGFGRGKQ